MVKVGTETTVYFGLWDNLDKSSPERLLAVNEVVSALAENETVNVSFDYNGRTRHAIASESFTSTMIREGFDNYDFEIGYNYEFKIKHR